MKALIIFMGLIISLSTNAMTCKSEDTLAKTLVLTKVSPDFVQGSSYIRAFGNVFSGTVQEKVFEKIYTLFNQEGKKFVFTVNKSINIVSHCRARFCPPTNDNSFEPLTAKLTSEGLEDEYFSCL